MGPFVCSCIVVKGHQPRSKVIRSQVVGLVQKEKLTSFEKLKFDCDLTFFIDIMLEPSLVHEVRGHR